MKLLKSLAVCFLADSGGEVFDVPRDIKDMCFADSALLSQVKLLNIWISSGIASVQKSIQHLPKKQVCHGQCSSSPCYRDVLHEQQLYSGS